MKRSTTQEKSTKGPPSKTLSSKKVQDMQKAYGISPKTTGSTSKSLRTTNTTTSQKSKSSVTGSGAVPSSKVSSDAGSTSTGRGYQTGISSRSSKTTTVSKANYAQSYNTSTTLSRKSEKGSPFSSNRKPISNNNNSPLNLASSPHKDSRISSSNSSTTSRLIVNQNPPTALYESDAGEDYDEEFEEDYESEFEEEVDSAEEEEEQEAIKSLKNVSEDISENEYDKSSSIREFEELEKMVEVQGLEESAKSSTLKVNGANDILGSGEPVASKFDPAPTAAPDEDESEEDESEQGSMPIQAQPAVTKGRNAFPATTGFSIASSAKAQRVSYQNEAPGFKKQAKTEEIPVVTVLSKGPEPDNEFQKRQRTNRGKIIQGMIKLDRVGAEIFHLAPYPYERFMSVFSGSDRLQASTQTDQDKSEESMQTESIDQTTKWTQKPPTWSTTSSSCDIRIVKQEALGVGSDEIDEDLSPDQKIHKQFDFFKNWEQLSKFIIRASRKMLYVLEAEQRIKLPTNSGNKGSLETIIMKRGLSVLSKLEMHTLAGDGEFVGCANGAPFQPYQDEKEEKVTNGNKKHASKNVITVWSLKEPSMPLFFLRVWGHVSALKVHMMGRLIVSGNRDGSISVWNLDEPLCYHSQYQEQLIRTPSVNTSCMLSVNISSIVGLEMFSESKNTFSIISIDKEGLIIIWSCLRSQDALGESSMSQHSSAWSTVHMSVRHEIRLNDITRGPLEITCFFAFLDVEAITTGFYFGAFNGYVAKGQITVDGSGNSKTGNASAILEKYQEKGDSNPRISCMDVSTKFNILAMGCEDGRCRLFEMSRKKLILSLGGKDEPIRVKWSGRRASILYVALKDSLLIWDLLSSDMTPWKTIHLKDIQDFVLYSPPHKEYLVIITGNDLIISTPSEEVRPLSNRDFSKMQSYFSVLC